MNKDRFKISIDHMGGWVRVFFSSGEPTGEVAGYLSKSLSEWMRGHPELRVNFIVPINCNGDTVELHAWYDQTQETSQSQPLAELSDDKLRILIHSCREMLRTLAQSLSHRPDIAVAVDQLMKSRDMPETYRELSAVYPDLSRLVLQASVAALVNVQSLEATDAEMKRRAMAGN